MTRKYEVEVEDICNTILRLLKVVHTKGEAEIIKAMNQGMDHCEKVIEETVRAEVARALNPVP